MTENLTESFGLWPWAAWLLLAGLCFTVELFRRDHLGTVGLLGCLAAAAVAVFHGLGFGWQVLAFTAGVAVAVVLTRGDRIAPAADGPGDRGGVG